MHTIKTIILLVAIPGVFGGTMQHVRDTERSIGAELAKKSTTNTSTIVSLDRMNDAILTPESQKILRAKNILAGANPTRSSNTASVWIGNDGKYRLQVTNNKNSPMILVMWDGKGGNPYLSQNKPLITMSMRAKERRTISANINARGIAFSAIYPNTQANGIIDNTWGEFTMGQYATINVSREPNMHGDQLSIHSRSSGCTTNMTTCVFVCRGGKSPCGKTKTYDLQNCRGRGTRNGFDPVTRDPSGGCDVGSGGDIDVNFS